MSKALRILVPLKRVLDPQIMPGLKNGTIQFSSNSKFSINPFDDIALEEALKLKEKHNDIIENISVVAIGDKKENTDILRNALAKGVSNAFLVENTTDPKWNNDLYEGKILSQVVEKLSSNLVMIGKQDVDSESNMKGGIIAGLLGWPMASNASKVEYDNNTGSFQVERETDNGHNIVEMQIPGVITADLRLNTPRYVSLSKLMKAKKKPIEILKLDNMPSEENKIEMLNVEEVVKFRKAEKLNSVDELISRIKEM